MNAGRAAPRCGEVDGVQIKDFSKGRNISSAHTAAPIRRPDQFFIGGEWVKPSSAAKIDVINSGTEVLFVEVAGRCT
jgi:hypothetical protein